MRLVKATLLGLIVVSLLSMWSHRDSVTDAYRTTPDTPRLRLSGVDLAFSRTQIDPSPFAIPAAADTRREVVAMLSVEAEADLRPAVEMSGGEATLVGTVDGPEGPVLGAIVRIERQTSHGIGSLDVVTGEDGRWSVTGVPGGRYRVRAWVPWLMTTGRSEVRYLAADEKAEFRFTVWGVDPSPYLGFVEAGPIYEGQAGTVAVAVSRRSIDAEGVVVTTPVVGALVSVEVTPEVTLASSPIQLTDFEGAARFVLRCQSALSSGSLTARSGVLLDTFPLPGCRALPITSAGPEPPPGSDRSDG